MPKLNSHQAHLLIILLKNPRPLSAEALGRQLGITARTVRYNLGMAESWLRTRDVELLQQPRVGITLKAPDATRKTLLAELQQEQTAALYNPEDRLKILIFELLTSGDFVSNATLEDSLSISRTTLARDLVSAEQLLSQNHLYLRRKAHQGLIIQGREDDLRYMLAALFKENFSYMALMDLFCWGKRAQDIEGVRPGSVQSHFLDRISAWDPPTAWRYISQIQDVLGISLVESDQLSLSLYFCIMVWRFRQGHVIDFPPEKVHEHASLPEFSLLRKIFDRYHHETGRRIPEVEIVQLAIETATSLQEANEGRELLELGILRDREISDELIQAFIHEVGQKISSQVQHPDVINRLTQHLRRSITRLNYGLMIANPLTEQVHKEYPSLWEATVEAAGILEKKLDITFPLEEIAYLTMYMGLLFQFHNDQPLKARPRIVVACPSGGVTVWMLVSRLRSEIPEIEIVDVVSIRQLSTIKLESVDALISTASFSLRQLPVITVSPFVDSQEVNMIRHRLNL